MTNERAEKAEERVRQLENELADAKNKCQKYDDVVNALHVCDGGRYRNDTIESVVSGAKASERLRNELASIRGAACDVLCSLSALDVVDAAREEWGEMNAEWFQESIDRLANLARPAAKAEENLR